MSDKVALATRALLDAIGYGKCPECAGPVSATITINRGGYVTWKHAVYCSAECQYPGLRYERNDKPVPHCVREFVFDRDGFTCQGCGIRDPWPGNALQLDHVVPRCRGGSNDPDNLQVLCGECNSRKGARV